MMLYLTYSFEGAKTCVTVEVKLLSASMESIEKDSSGGSADNTIREVRRVLDFSMEGTASFGAGNDQIPVADGFVEGGSIEDLCSVHVPRSVSVVKISWQLILEQIRKKLGLDMSDFGTHDEPDGMYTAFIKMQVPANGLSPIKKTEIFIGEEEKFASEAMESAAKAAVCYMRKYCGLIIEDASSYELKKVRRDLARAEFFSSTYGEMLDSRGKREAAIRQEYKDVLHRTKQLCLEFKDIFPVASTIVTSDCTSSTEKLVYTGNSGRKSRAEEFALAFVNLLNAASNMAP